VLGADRPPRLRGTWANQTSDLQAEMFGAATRLTVDLGPADGPDRWGAAARAAVIAASRGGGPPGPAYLNLGFDEPLVPADDDWWWRPPLAGLEPAADGVRAGAIEPPADAGRQVAAGREIGELDLTRRTVIVAGDRAGPTARLLAERLGLPLLAEPTSGARGGVNAVGPYRLLLDRPDLGGRVEQVVVFGRPTLSRPVTGLLARTDVAVVLVAERPDDPGPERHDVRRVGAAVATGWLERPVRPAPEGGAWLSSWQRAGRVAVRAVDGVLDGWPILTGPVVAREIAAATASDDALVVAASNPVRDLDLAGAPWPWWPGHGLVHAGRGLSGIDGTVATAMGVALGSARPTRVLVGDVAFLHDLGALVLGPREERPDITVVVLNDQGGGIFSLLEPGADAERDAASAERFDRLFGTPHKVRLAELCAGLGVAHAVVASAAGLRERLAAPVRGLGVLEVRVDREDLQPLHQAIDRAVLAAVDAELS
jgi:2-succinyl-5-enolpyruvyl-6-hydroxy-3-cyclohexene-1-carboxylate synthase